MAKFRRSSDIGDFLDLAVRAYSQTSKPSRSGSSNSRRHDRCFLILDTETTVDPTQRLLFGVWRYCRADWLAKPAPRLTCVQEGVFYPDDLAERDQASTGALASYAKRSRHADVETTAPDVERQLLAYPLSRFLDEVFWRVAYKLRACVVFFNAPFDLSRLAWRAGETRNRKGTDADAFAGGFSLALWSYAQDGEPTESLYRPRVVIKTIDSKRALKGFRAPLYADDSDLIPEDGDWAPDRKLSFRGNLLDLRTLAFSLSDRSHTLESACDDFGVPYTKRKVEHGKVTEEYIDYCREDVGATQKLCQATLREFERHPIPLQATRAYSPATIGRSYLKAMGITPPRSRQAFSDRVLGWAMSAYYGGRSECRIRRVSVPVVYCDFASMYPTVCALMGLWGLLTADRIDANEATRDTQELLDRVELDDCFDPAFWTKLVGVAAIRPDGDVVPVRARYTNAPTFQIGINPLHCEAPMWFTIADLVASKLLTGKTPRIERAYRFEARGTCSNLGRVSLLGSVGIEPAEQDFFKVVVEQRQEEKRHGEPWREKGLKVIGNSASYGIYAQMTRRELPIDRTEVVHLYGARQEPWQRRVAAPEDPGDYCFPPIAAAITGGARLMLAMLERGVADAGGTYAFCDTDSMAIVSTRSGGLVACPGGDARTADGKQAIKALSWRAVSRIRRRFEGLNPYDRTAVRGSILELEDENFVDKSRRKRKQLWCYAISAKRYVLYNHGREVGPELRTVTDLSETAHVPAEDTSGLTLRKPSEHGLGHLRNPADPEDSDRSWIAESWELLLRKALGLSVIEPEWLDRPAVARTGVSTPRTLRMFKSLNADKTYADQIKPFGFLNAAFVHPVERPVDEPRVVLIAPYQPDSRRWLTDTWINRYSGREYQITTKPSAGRVRQGVITVKTYRDVIEEFATHPEAKSAGTDGAPCRRNTVGLLRRRPVQALSVIHIGKESNRLEDVQAGLVQDPDEVVSRYDDVLYERFRLHAVSRLRRLGVRETVRRTGHSVGAVSAALSGRSRPRPAHLRTYLAVAELL